MSGFGAVQATPVSGAALIGARGRVADVVLQGGGVRRFSVYYDLVLLTNTRRIICYKHLGLIFGVDV